jgi:hypothetical protein
MSKWSSLSVALNDAWGPGADHSLKAPVGRMPEFAVRARYLRDDKGTAHEGHYAIDFSSGYLADGWQGVHFVPMGTQKVQGIKSLPPWGPGQQSAYRTAIANAAGELAQSGTARLEAVLAYTGTGGVGYNKIKLFYVEGAVTDPKHPDLIVISIATHVAAAGTVRASQDGSAHGPPG